MQGHCKLKDKKPLKQLLIHSVIHKALDPAHHLLQPSEQF